MTSSTYLTSEIAAQFPSEISDGFSRPHLGWSAFGPSHLNGVGCDCMTSNVWVGPPAALLSFMQDLAAHYERMKADLDEDFDAEYEGVSLGYWEKDGLAMAGEFCTGDTFFEQTSAELVERSKEFNLVLCDGNDNDPGDILQNQVVCDPLDVASRLTLAHFMTTSAYWVFIEDEHPDGRKLEGFTDDNRAALRSILGKAPSAE